MFMYCYERDEQNARCTEEDLSRNNIQKQGVNSPFWNGEVDYFFRFAKKLHDVKGVSNGVALPNILLDLVTVTEMSKSDRATISR